MKVNCTFHSVDINLLGHNHFRIESAYTIFFVLWLCSQPAISLFNFNAHIRKFNNWPHRQPFHHSPRSKRLFTLISFTQVFLKVFRHFQWRLFFFLRKICQQKIVNHFKSKFSNVYASNGCIQPFIAKMALFSTWSRKFSILVPTQLDNQRRHESKHVKSFIQSPKHDIFEANSLPKSA